MAETIGWNNAFSAGAGGGGSISVQGMSLPGGDASGAGAFAQMFAAGQSNRTARQNLLMERERLNMQRQQMDMEMAKETTSMIAKQREMQQLKLAGTIFQRNTDPETGAVNYQGVIAGMAQVPELADMAIGVTEKMLQMNKLDKEGLKAQLENSERMHSAVGRRAGYLLKMTREAGRPITSGDVVQQLAEGVAAGDFTKDFATGLIQQMASPGPALQKQVESLFQSSTQSAESIKLLTGTLQEVNQGGQTSFVTVDQQPGRTTIQKAGGEAVLPQVPTSEQNSQTVETQEGGRTIVRRRSDVPDLAPVSGGLNPQKPSIEAPGADPAALPAGVDVGPTASTVKRREADETVFRERMQTVSDDAKNANAVLANIKQAEDALEQFNPGSGMTTLFMPMAKMFQAAGLKDFGDSLAGGSLSAAQVFDAASNKSAFSAIKSLGVTNRDLSAAETEMSKKTTFGPDMEKKTSATIIKFMKDYAKLQIKKEQFMAKFYAEYKKDPDGALKRGFDPSQAEAIFNRKMAEEKNGGWQFGGTSGN
jgi:hypothetical protein